MAHSESAPGALFLAIHTGLLGESSLGLLRHCAQGGEKAHVSLCLVQLRHPILPREGHLAVRCPDVQPIGSQCLFDQAGLGVHQLPQVVERGLGETILRQGNRKAGGILRLRDRLGFLREEACGSEVCQDVRAVRVNDAAALGHGDLTNVAVAGGHGAVDGFFAGDFSDGGNESLARGSVQIHLVFYGLYLQSVCISRLGYCINHSTAAE